MRHIHYEEFRLPHFFFHNPTSGLFWFIIRMYVGWEWLSAGFAKVTSPLWFGSNAGAPLTGFVQGALGKTVGLHPDVSIWYATFLQNTVLPHVTTWSNVVAVGELLVGIALILGFTVGIAAFFGSFMNFNFLLAGTVSVNPVLFLLGVFLVLAWRVSGYIGLDYYILPRLHHFLKRP